MDMTAWIYSNKKQELHREGNFIMPLKSLHEAIFSSKNNIISI